MTRFLIFISLFVLLAFFEHKRPRRKRAEPRQTRWFTNWAISILDALSLRLLALFIPLLAIGAAQDAEHNEIGFFNLVHLPGWAEFIITLLIFDFAIWLQHLITHKVPFLWRFHRVHHSDRDIDVTTAIRFHPVEIAFSMGLKIGLVYSLGASPLAVIAFEIMLNGTAMFNHANLKLPLKLDRLLRLLIVTPDMHRVHHSVDRQEHDSNYGFALSIWDRLFKTYIPQPRHGHDEMQIGLRWQDERPSKLSWALLLPFRKL